MAEESKIDIIGTLKTIDERSRKIERDGKGDARTLGLCCNLLAAIVYGQERRLQALEKRQADLDAEPSYGNRRA